MKLCPIAEQIAKYKIFCRITGLDRQNCSPDPASPRKTDSRAAVRAMYRFVQNMKS